MGFQADIEAFNGRWQRRVYGRTFGHGIEEIAVLSDRYLEAVRARRAGRIESAPPRRSWSDGPGPRPRRGRIVFVRRTTIGGDVEILGRRHPLDAARLHRLVRAELDLDDLVIRYYALRRRDPDHQPLIAEVPYVLPGNRAWVARMY